MRKNGKSIVFLTLFLGFVALGSGCTNRQEFTGTVVEVRITNLLKSKMPGGDKSGDAFIGALIGGAITGGIGGAAVGAAVGADGEKPSQPQYVIEPLACKFFAKISDGAYLEFAYPQAWDSSQDLCTLLRIGDTVSIEKLTGEIVKYHWLNARGRSGPGLVIGATE